MIKFGLLTAILDGWTYEEAVDIAAQMGFRCLEVACWPAGKAGRRYAGVSHIDAERVLEDDAYAQYVLDTALKVVEAKIDRFDLVKMGEIPPERCGTCEYCKQTKILTAPRVYEPEEV